MIDALRYEQAQGAMKIAKFYDNKKQVQAALVYYNEVLIKDPDSPMAGEAKRGIEFLKTLPGVTAAIAPTTNAAPTEATKPQ